MRTLLSLKRKKVQEVCFLKLRLFLLNINENTPISLVVRNV